MKCLGGDLPAASSTRDFGVQAMPDSASQVSGPASTPHLHRRFDTFGILWQVVQARVCHARRWYGKVCVHHCWERAHSIFGPFKAKNASKFPHERT